MTASLTIIVARRADSLTDYVDTVTALSQDSQLHSDHITTYRARKSVQMKSEKPFPLHGDGEVLKDRRPIDADVVPGALNVIMPQARI